MSDVHGLVFTMVADKISMASSSHTLSTLWHSESKVYLILLKKSRSQGEFNFFLKVTLQSLLAMLIKAPGTNKSSLHILTRNLSFYLQKFT